MDGASDVWTWTALDADTELIVSWFVGDRSGQSAIIVMDDLCSPFSTACNSRQTVTRRTWRLEAVEGAFGAGTNYAQQIKLYGDVPSGVLGQFW
jgi:hypothetical protein